jgi:hypothetical protein
MRKKASPPREPSAPLAGLLVIVELGGEWPQLAVRQAAAGPRRVVVQVDGETPSEFADRVANSLDRLFERGIKLDTVALASNQRLDEEAERARRKVASLALGRMAIAKHMSGRVVLTAPLRSGRTRHALSALAHDLSEEWRTAGLEVSVSLDGQCPPTPVTSAFTPSAYVA